MKLELANKGHSIIIDKQWISHIEDYLYFIKDKHRGEITAHYFVNHLCQGGKGLPHHNETLVGYRRSGKTGRLGACMRCNITVPNEVLNKARVFWRLAV